MTEITNRLKAIENVLEKHRQELVFLRERSGRDWEEMFSVVDRKVSEGGGGTMDYIADLDEGAAIQAARNVHANLLLALDGSAQYPDSVIKESSVTQHEAALSITEGQISDLGNTILLHSDVDDTPVNGEVTVPVSSNWAYDHAANASAHHTKYTDEEAQDAVGAMVGDSLVYTDGTPELDTVQDIRTAASPTFADLTLNSPSNIYALSHNSFADVSANEHVDHTTVTLTAGNGLTGGGTIAASRTFAVGAGNGISVAADSVAVDQSYGFTWTGQHEFQDTMQTEHIYPRATDAYDLGSSSLLWRKGWLSELDTVLYAQNSVQVTGGWWMIPHSSGTLAEDVDGSETQIDFGSGLTSGDFVVLRGNGQVEYMTIGSLVGGTTYNVTRNVDGSGTNTWPQGHAWVNFGQSGDGRIEFDAQTQGPRILVITQGATYNSRTDIAVLGDLNGWGPYSSTTYGIAIGNYSGGDYLKWDATNGLVIAGDGAGITNIDGGNIQTNTVTATQISVSQLSAISANMGTLTAGEIRMYSGTWDSNATGFRLNSTEIAGQNSGTDQVRLSASDGKLYAGAGAVTLSASGLSINRTTGGDPSISLPASKYGIVWDDCATVTAIGDTTNTAEHLCLRAGLLTSSYSKSIVSIVTQVSDVLGPSIQVIAGTNNNYIELDNRQSGGDRTYMILGEDGTPGSEDVYIAGTVKSFSIESTGSISAATSISAPLIYTPNYMYALGGVHVGGSSDPGTDNLVVDGYAVVGSYLYVYGGVYESTALGCRACRSSAQAIAHNSWTAVSFNTEIHDTDNCFTATSSRMYTRHSGYYMAGGNVQWQSSTDGARGIRVLVNGTTQLVTQAYDVPDVPWSWYLSIATGMFWMDANEYIEIQVYQSSGASLNAEWADGWLARIP
jgi:hypothetical protein